MADSEGTGMDRLLKQITNPWDWAFGIAGAAAGAGITFATSGMDLGNSIFGGFTTGITARRAIVASFQRKFLRNRVEALRSQIQARSISQPAILSLIEELDLEVSLWESRTISNEEFANQLGRIIEKLRSTVSSHTLKSLGAAPPGTGHSTSLPPIAGPGSANPADRADD
jgi:hypothetical protein